MTKCRNLFISYQRTEIQNRASNRKVATVKYTTDKKTPTVNKVTKKIIPNLVPHLRNTQLSTSEMVFIYAISSNLFNIDFS